MRRQAAVLTTIGICGLLAACGGESGHTIVGTMEIRTDEGVVRTTDGRCTGRGGYNDLSKGAQVVVRDQHNDIVGTSELGAGKPDGWCDFPFTVKVPNRDVYQVEVSHRGAITYSRSKLEDANWRLHLTVG